MSKIQIINVPINDLNPAPYNPRIWSDKATENLTNSIKDYGLVDPILVNEAPSRKNIVIGGHFRLKIAKDLGFKEVPVIYLNIPDENKEKELNLRLNANQGDWDYSLLRDFDVDMLLDVGFDDTDLSNIWDEVLETEDDNFNVGKEIKEIKEATVKEGEIYQLGNHRLICGDSTDLEVIKKLVGKDKPDMIYSDPPYNINLNYSSGIGGKSNYSRSKVNDNKSEEEYRNFIKATLENGLKVSKKDLHIFYWCDEKYIGSVQNLYRELGIENKRVCLWIKNNQNVTLQVAFNKVFEPCVYGTIGKPWINKKHTSFNEILNKEIGSGNRLIDDVMDLFNIWLVKRLPSNEYKHPTEKPPTLHEKALRRCTKPGDIVLDLFGGSGSALISCEQMNRKAYLCEIDPIFCTLIINRYEKLTGKKATKIN